MDTLGGHTVGPSYIAFQRWHIIIYFIGEYKFWIFFKRSLAIWLYVPKTRIYDNVLLDGKNKYIYICIRLINLRFIREHIDIWKCQPSMHKLLSLLSCLHSNNNIHIICKGEMQIAWNDQRRVPYKAAAQRVIFTMMSK